MRDTGSSMELEERIRSYIREKNLITEGDTVCVGFSGGADSLCLLLMLSSLRSAWGFRLCVAHVNHHLRGASAEADEAFAKSFCEKQGIPLRIFHFDVSGMAEKRNCSIEEAGRLARLEAWHRCGEEDGVTRIALAHHRNDQAETMLFRAARGTSLSGLAGIRAEQAFTRPDGSRMMLIRPLLCAGRPEIEAWLQEKGYSWQTDETNSDVGFARNGIRCRVIPYLEDQVNPETVRHLADLASDAEEADAFLREEALRRSVRYLEWQKDPGKGIVYLRKSLRDEPAVMQRYILQEMLAKAAGSEKDLGRRQLNQLRSLLDMPAGKTVDLPYDLKAVREYDGIRICPVRLMRESCPEDSDVSVLLPDMEAGTVRTACLGKWTFRFGVLPRRDCPDPIPQKEYTKWLDYDRINKCLTIRYRRNGDFLAAGSDESRKKLKKYLADSKIPRLERDRIPLLASGPEVFWIVGGRISEHAKVRPDTERILKITAVSTDSGQETADERDDQSTGGREQD